jgi:hypothetical protein
MVLEQKMYSCQGCGGTYDNPQTARQCEFKGYQDIDVKPGTLFMHDLEEEVYAILLLGKASDEDAKCLDFPGHFPLYVSLRLELKKLSSERPYVDVSREPEVFNVLDELEDLADTEYQFAQGVFGMVDFESYGLETPDGFYKGNVLDLVEEDESEKGKLERALQVAIASEEFEEAAEIRNLLGELPD